LFVSSSMSSLYVIPYIINKIKILCLEIIKQRTSQNLQS
jgi:hypothetical protein